MKTEQEFTPKYWVLHDIDSDDVYIDTLAKSYTTCKNLSAMLYCDEMHTDNVQISPVEIKLVNLK